MRFPSMGQSARPAPWTTCTALILTAVLWQTDLSAAERRGGIEIGAKGVKATAVEIGEGPSGRTIKTILNKVSNTTVTAGVVETGKYDPNAIRETATEAGNFARLMRDEFGIPPEKVRVIGSSGLPTATNRHALVEAVKEATGLPAMEFLSPCREVELTIAGLTTEAERKNAILVDVGSGNTKGGYIGTGNQPVCFSIPLGSVTYAGRVSRDSPREPFPAAAGRSFGRSSWKLHCPSRSAPIRNFPPVRSYSSPVEQLTR